MAQILEAFEDRFGLSISEFLLIVVVAALFIVPAIKSWKEMIDRHLK